MASGYIGHRLVLTLDRSLADFHSVLHTVCMRMMRALFFLFAVAGCNERIREDEVQKIEMKLTGATELRVQISRPGQGRFEYGGAMAESGSFVVSPRQFDRLIALLRPFGPNAQTDYAEVRCNERRTASPNAESFRVRWFGKERDAEYITDLGCVTAAQNERLFDVLQSLPIPGGSKTL